MTHWEEFRRDRNSQQMRTWWKADLLGVDQKPVQFFLHGWCIWLFSLSVPLKFGRAFGSKIECEVLNPATQSCQILRIYSSHKPGIKTSPCGRNRMWKGWSSMGDLNLLKYDFFRPPAAGCLMLTSASYHVAGEGYPPPARQHAVSIGSEWGGEGHADVIWTYFTR